MLTEEIIEYCCDLKDGIYSEATFNSISDKLEELSNQIESEDCTLSKDEIMQIVFDAIMFYSSTLLYLKNDSDEKYCAVLEKFQLLFG